MKLVMHGRNNRRRAQGKRAGISLLLLLVGCAPSSSPRPAAAPATPAANHARQPLPDNGEAGDIRVCLLDEPLTTISIKAANPAMIVASFDTKPLRTIPTGESFELTRSKAGWTIAGETLVADSIEIHPQSSPGLWIDDHLYRGFLRITPLGNHSLQVINVLPLEHYVAGVVDGEIPAQFPAETRKAQAVAIRTFAVMQRETADPADDFDLRASAERSQSYLGYQYRDSRGRLLSGESDAARLAVQETRGLICARNGRPFRTYYSACCGGRTTKGTLFFPDAVEIPSIACDACGDYPRSRWTARLSAEELTEAVRIASRGKLPEPFRLADVTVEGASRRDAIPRILLRDMKNRTVTASTAALRSAVGGGKLLSAWFTVRPDGAEFVLEGRGHGHGVGLCQWGAAGLAEAGADFRTILARYYPGCEILPISSLLRGTKDRP